MKTWNFTNYATHELKCYVFILEGMTFLWVLVGALEAHPMCYFLVRLESEEWQDFQKDKDTFRKYLEFCSYQDR